MSFEKLPYWEIPVEEHRRRIEFLTRYRDQLTELFDRLERGSTESDKVELLRKIEQSTPSASDMIRLADVSLIVSEAQRDLISNRAKWLKIGENFDLLANFSWLETPGLRKEAISRVNQAIGRYQDAMSAIPRQTVQGKRLSLKEACEKGQRLLQGPYVLKQYYKAWNEGTLEQLKSAFGETSSIVKDFEDNELVPKQQGSKKFYSCPNGHRFTSQISKCPTCGERGREDSTRLILMKQLQVLEAQGWMLPTASDDFFDEFDSDIRRVSRQLFKDGHFADAVSAAFKELNTQVKAEYKKRKNKEQDGASLMEFAFSVGPSVLRTVEPTERTIPGFSDPAFSPCGLFSNPRASHQPQQRLLTS